MPDPRHSLHVLLRRSCSHICDPPHSLQKLFWRLWGHRTSSLLAFDRFTAVIGKFNNVDQRLYTCPLDSPPLLVRLQQLPCAPDILHYMCAKYNGRRLLAADVLFQSPATAGSTQFSTHRDNAAELEHAAITVVLKLTHSTSCMQVIECSETEYPLCAGSFLCFRSGSLHRTIVAADTDQYKLVLSYSCYHAV